MKQKLHARFINGRLLSNSTSNKIKLNLFILHSNIRGGDKNTIFIVFESLLILDSSQIDFVYK